MSKLPKFENKNLLVGIGTSDDAAVYKINDTAAMIQTVDFFTPVVDDPYTFGEIAAANALSDVYAMGGEVQVALNIVGFPSCLDPSVLSSVMEGGASKVKEAGAVLVGGHSIQTEEPIYGLSVTGFVHPDRIWTNSGAKEGDILILTKQLGTGIINTAVKGSLASYDSSAEAVRVMRSLNKKAADVLRDFDIHACTDITGFGLIGHAMEMAKGSGLCMVIDSKNIPVITGAIELAAMGMVPGGTYRNRQYLENDVISSDIGEEMLDVMYDPQSSGGLLAAVGEKDADIIINALNEAGLETSAAVIGCVAKNNDCFIRLI